MVDPEILHDYAEDLADKQFGPIDDCDVIAIYEYNDDEYLVHCDGAVEMLLINDQGRLLDVIEIDALSEDERGPRIWPDGDDS